MSILVQVYSLGEIGPRRSMATAFLLVNINCLFVSILIYNAYNQFLQNCINRKKIWLFLMVLTFILVLCFRKGPDQTTLFRALGTIAHAPSTYQSFMQRIDLMKYNPQGKDFVFQPLVKDPITLFTDITDDPNHWSNRCFSRYFTIDSVVIESKKDSVH